MQAIETRFLGPTNTRDARVKAIADAGSVTLVWDDHIDIEPNHDRAAMALRTKLGWDQDCYGDMVRGCVTNSSGYVYVFIDESSIVARNEEESATRVYVQRIRDGEGPGLSEKDGHSEAKRLGYIRKNDNGHFYVTRKGVRLLAGVAS